ncbi:MULTISPECIES: DUF6233 domain-containing protein [unclassified Streptomyces]|uniref:DUF6233 domain-containing protein n=1 Tax=Streptomyces sp. NBC_00119 TaxID=2975659 RepID=A0AAU1UGG8_9ACTN|nr:MULTISPECIES: DUF6233 domain-containing protein [unclassified Streptomyces]MCX4645876.1 DUF6233 domain-containing protein [Streptomyces sp. NBC_01446]MCX5318500.1 DUF6233 domain-containing protein [Streptomyces sp. NBC_00120]
MNDSSTPRLDMLRFARRIAVQQVEQIDRWIAAEERRETERRHGEQARPPAPDWLIETGLGRRDPVYVHVGGCHMAGKRSRGVDRDQALRGMTEGVAACPHCRPDTELGVLD